MKQETRRPYAQNRELSWLKFNERVLEEAEVPTVPLMERMKFVSIFSSNLDEFFMVRVGSMFDLSLMDPEKLDNKTGMTANEQLAAIYKAVRPLYDRKTKVYIKIKEELIKQGITSLDFADLGDDDLAYVTDYYKTQIKPILAPQIVDAHHPFPHIATKDIYIMALLRRKSDVIMALLPVPAPLPDLVFLPNHDTLRYIRTEKVLYAFLDDVFSKYEVLEKNCICVTRNAEIRTEDEEFEVEGDFRRRMKELLHKRKRLSVVRLEANYPMSEQFSAFLCKRFSIQKEQIFISNTALKMGYVFHLFGKLNEVQQQRLTFRPLDAGVLRPPAGMMQRVEAQDLLLFHPYESMDPFLQLIREAAHDPEVISIKITIYRLAKRAKLVDYLCQAAENGKEVSVLMELRARFDEQNNIDWSERLEDAGCRIIYGFDEYKVHSKICLITVRGQTGIRYITQVGTGNYNEKTAELYTDFSLMTAHQGIGQDAVAFFQNISIGHVDGGYRHLLVAPRQLKDPLLARMDEEIAKGSLGRIRIKINSLTDIDFIDKLAEASKAGVDVQLIVRGICCILPGVPGETDNLKIQSVVGRFLEHTRSYSFGTGAEQTVYIASADLMTRNTERRIEVACPVLDPGIRAKLDEIFESIWADNTKSRVLTRKGNYVLKQDETERKNAQEQFLEEYKERPKPPQEAKLLPAPKQSFWARLFGKK